MEPVIKKKMTVLITGGTSGLGLDLFKLMISEGHDIFITGRNLKTGTVPEGKYSFLKADFSDLEEVKHSAIAFIEKGTRFDIVINNAGILSPGNFLLTKDGFEYTFQINFLSHFLINDLILRNNIFNSGMKIISVTSPVYRNVRPTWRLPSPEEYKPFRTYSESKLYMLLMGLYLKEKYDTKDFHYAGFDPGVFSSGIFRSRGAVFRSLYTIAAPVMRSSRSVARKLSEVTELPPEPGIIVYSYKEKPVRFSAEGPEWEQFRSMMSVVEEKTSAFIRD